MQLTYMLHIYYSCISILSYLIDNVSDSLPLSLNVSESLFGIAICPAAQHQLPKFGSLYLQEYLVQVTSILFLSCVLSISTRLDGSE